MVLNRCPWPNFREFDDNGDPLSGGKLYSYIAGSATPLATYDENGDLNSNPVILDTAGRAHVYLDETKVYKLVLKSSAGVTIWTEDNVSGSEVSGGISGSYLKLDTSNGPLTIGGWRLYFPAITYNATIATEKYVVDSIAAQTIPDLADVSISGITNGQGLQWNSSTQLFERGGPWLPLAGGLSYKTSFTYSSGISYFRIARLSVSSGDFAVTLPFTMFAGTPGLDENLLYIDVVRQGGSFGASKVYGNCSGSLVGYGLASIDESSTNVVDVYVVVQGGVIGAGSVEIHWGQICRNSHGASADFTGGTLVEGAPSAPGNSVAVLFAHEYGVHYVTGLNSSGTATIPTIKARASTGLTLQSSSGTNIGTLGASDTANVGWNGSHGFAGYLQSVRSAAGDSSLIATVSGDSSFRFRTYADGKHEWGSGSATADTNLYRNAADSLATDDNFQGPRCRLTPDGGIAIKLTAGENLTKGELVQASSSADNQCIKSVADGGAPIGVVYETATSGNDVWIVIQGRAQALLQDSTASTCGYWVRTSITTAGRVDATNAAPPGGTIAALEIHAKGCGHCLETKTSGTNVLAWIMVHFN